MKNYIQRGEILDVTLTAATTSGALVKIGDLVGIASNDGAIGETVAVSVKGVFEVPKAAVAITQGQKLYLVVADGNLSATEAENTFVGYAAQAAAVGDATVQVKIG